MQQLEKEINTTNKKSMVNRYKMYRTSVAELAEKTQNGTKKGDRK